MFTTEGHIEIKPDEVLAHARENPRDLVNNYLLTGTPRVFATYARYCDFLKEVGSRFGLHPRSLLVRGSAHLGYSIAPKSKAWTQLRFNSDIDIAVVDVDYYERMEAEVHRWDERQGSVSAYGANMKKALRRQTLCQFFCCSDEELPPNTCVHHCDTMSRIDTTPFCGNKRRLSAFVFRDWWCLRNRYEYDLKELCEGIEKGVIPAPPNDSEADDGSSAANIT